MQGATCRQHSGIGLRRNIGPAPGVPSCKPACFPAAAMLCTPSHLVWVHCQHQLPPLGLEGVSGQRSTGGGEAHHLQHNTQEEDSTRNVAVIRSRNWHQRPELIRGRELGQRDQGEYSIHMQYPHATSPPVLPASEVTLSC